MNEMCCCCCCCCNKLGHNRDIFFFHILTQLSSTVFNFSQGTIGLQREKDSRKYANAKQKCNEQKQQKQRHLVLVSVQHINDKNNILLIPPTTPCIQKRKGCGDDGVPTSVAPHGRQCQPGARRQHTPGVGDGCSQRLPHNLNRKDNVLWYSHSNKSRIMLEQIQGKIL